MHILEIQYRAFRSKIATNIQTIFLISVTLLLAGCPLLDDDNNDSSDSETVGSDSAVSVVVELSVLDEDGLVLADPSVESPVELLSQSQDENEPLLLEYEPAESAMVLRVSKSGYETALAYLPNLLASQSITVRLKERLPPIRVDGFSGGDFSGVDGARVNIAGESLVRPDGSTAFGDIELFINTVDTSDDGDLESFPGSFEGLAAADTEPGILASLGVSSFSFEQNGEKLQLKEGEVAQLTLPLFAGEYEDGTPIPLGDLIPIWRLNEDTGIWEEESTGVVVAMPNSPTGLGLQGSTSHFSSFNADIWGRNSSGFGGQAGPAGQTRNLPQVCRMSVRVPEFEPATRYNARVVMNLGVLASTRPISGIYYEPFTFPVFQGRPASLRLSQPNYNEGEGRSLVQSFTCSSDTMELVVTFEDVPAFFSVEAQPEAVFGLVNGQNEVIKNTLEVKASFINDSDDLVQVTTNLGVEQMLGNGQVAYIDYFDTEPNPASIAFFLENEISTADSQLLIDYLAEAPPRIRGTYANKEDGRAVFRWHGAQGADTVQITQYNILTEEVGAVITPEIDATAPNGTIDDIGFDLPGGFYMMIFRNQYGTRGEPVFLSESQDECIPDSDLPCAA